MRLKGKPNSAWRTFNKFCKSNFATVMATDKPLGMKIGPKNASLHCNELITINFDVVALLGHAAREFSHLRRENTKASP